MKVSLERKIAFGFGAAALVLALVAIAAVWNVQWMQSTFFWVDHTRSALHRLEQSATEIMRLQTSTRGYLLTGEEPMLRVFREGDAGLARSLADLRQLVADNPAQLQRLTELERLTTAARAIMQERITVRRTRGLAAASESSALLAGQTAVEKCLALVETMKAAEHRLLDDRLLRSRRATTATLAAILVVSSLAIALTLVAAFVAYRDLTRRRLAEEERNRIFNLSRDLIALAGFDGVFQRVNPAWTTTLGLSEAELLSHPFISFVHPDDVAATQAAAARLVAGEELISFENRYRARDGSHRWLLWSARPIPERRQIIASARDITDRKQAEADIHHLNAALASRAQQLEAANRELESFSYSVSHDLRAPLRHIDGFATLLGKRVERLDAECQRFTQVISRAAKQMGTLIDDLLAFSRIARTPLRRQRVDSRTLVTTLIAERRYGSPERPIQWHIGALPEVLADPGLLQLVWSNLLDNAVKYSGRCAAPEITLAAEHDPGAGVYVFSVRDNGVGFDMAYADKLFGVFQRLHSPADFEGTGIGLANVHRIVTRHGGRVWAEGRVDQGATFFFTLPSETAAIPPPA